MRTSPHARSASESTSMNTAPTMGPGNVRRPPTITITTMIAISLNFIGVGDSKPT